MVRSVLVILAAFCYTAAPPVDEQTPEERPASQPASRPATWHPRRPPVQAEIYRELLRDSERTPASPILPVNPETGTSVSGAEAGSGAALLPEGTVLVDRSGRLGRVGERSEFHFSPGNSPEGVPAALEILRNGLLEVMEVEAEAGVTEFVITAEVTRYRDRNYLLLRKCHRQVSHGNLSP